MPRKTKLVKSMTNRQRIIKMRKSIAEATEPVMVKHVALRDKATEGWGKNKPKIVKLTKNITNPGQPMIWQVIMYAPIARGSKEGHTVYRMLSDARHGKLATEVRYAFLRYGDDPKTKPNKFGVFGTGGVVLFVSKYFPMPGIVARNWEVLIAQLLNPEFEKALQEGGQNGLQR